jgi:hypothetical protein
MAWFSKTPGTAVEKHGIFGKKAFFGGILPQLASE